MLFFCLYVCFTTHAASVSFATENLFSDGNDQPLSASLFTLEDLGPIDSIDLSSQPGNPNPTDLFQPSIEFGDATPFDADPKQLGSSLVLAGSQDIFDFTSGEDLSDFTDGALFSEDIVAANECGWDSSQVQGRVRARGSTCSNPTQENGVSGSSPPNNNKDPTKKDDEEPQPSTGEDVGDWDKTCKNNGFDNVMVCSSGNPGDDQNQRLPVTDEAYVSLDYGSASTYSNPLEFKRTQPKPLPQS